MTTLSQVTLSISGDTFKFWCLGVDVSELGDYARLSERDNVPVALFEPLVSLLKALGYTLLTDAPGMGIYCYQRMADDTKLPEPVDMRSRRRKGCAAVRRDDAHQSVIEKALARKRVP